MHAKDTNHAGEKMALDVFSPTFYKKIISSILKTCPRSHVVVAAQLSLKKVVRQ